MKKLIRDSVFRIEQYEPGKPAEILREELSIKGDISKLASNENPLGPSPIAIQAVKKSLDEGNFYPENSCYQLKEKLARYLGVDKENVGVGNGTTELILMLGFTFLNPGEEFVMSQSSFIMGKIVAQAMNAKLIEIPLKDFRHDLGNFLRATTANTKIVYIDNPMNPIGTMVYQQEIEEFMEKVPEDILVVFDEAYYEYVNKERSWPTIDYVKEGRNVVVLRTFSKMYGLAGFRVGYCLAREDLVEAISRVKPPFSVNRFAQVGAVAALDDKEHVKRTKEINEAGKKFLCEHFREMGVFYIPSETNFITIDIKADAKKIFEDIQKKGVIVRPLNMYGKPTFLRVTIGTTDQNKRFIEAFKQVYQNYGS